MFHIALCDDESVFFKQVKKLLDRYVVKNDTDPEFKFELRYFSTAKELMETDYVYDVLFLDIMLEDGQDGIDVGIELRRRGVDAIFFLLTSMERFQDGYRANVLRYLKKPLDTMDFFEAMDAAVHEFHIPRKRFAICTRSGTVYVSLSDIILADTYYRRRTVYTVKGDFVTTEEWKELSERLPDGHFYSPQKTVRINFEHVQEANSAGILMDNERRVSFSRSVKGNYMKFNREFQKYLGG